MKRTTTPSSAPQMSPIHFDLLVPAFKAAGYNMVIPDIPARECVDVGLKFVNNDACYPSLIVVGQIMAAVKSGNYDMTHTAIPHLTDRWRMPCNKLHRLYPKSPLEKAGYPDVPVISINMVGLEKTRALSLLQASSSTDCMRLSLVISLCAVSTGYVLMRKSREVPMHSMRSGKESHRLCRQHKDALSQEIQKYVPLEIIRDFDNLPMTDEVKPRVGVVGEILVKFLPAANNYVVDLLEAEGAEAVVPDLTDFLLYCCYNTNFKADYLGASKKLSL